MNEYWLIFKEGNHWVNKFFKKGFGHIAVLTKDRFNWVMIDPTVHNMGIEILDASIDNDVPKALAITKHKVIYVKTNSMLKNSFLSLFKRGNCVELVKMIRY